MRTIAGCVCALMVCLVAAAAEAQTFPDLQITLGTYAATQEDGEKPGGVWRSTGPVTIGKPISSTFSLGPTCDAFAVSSEKGDVRDDATTAWYIEVTPIRVVDDAVTFRLQWTRLSGLRQQLERISLDSGAARPQDETITLRPGESMPVDSVPVPTGAKTIEGRHCRGNASIRVAVEPYPSDAFERRLIATDLWLIERLPNGAELERGQQASVRGLPGRRALVYFDSIVDGSVALDVSGVVTPQLAGKAMTVAVQTRSRWSDVAAARYSSGTLRSVESEIHIKGSEIVEVRLPVLESGPFAKREFAIRIRARQLR